MNQALTARKVALHLLVGAQLLLDHAALPNEALLRIAKRARCLIASALCVVEFFVLVIELAYCTHGNLASIAVDAVRLA